MTTPTSATDDTPETTTIDDDAHLGSQERAVLAVFLECSGRVISRREIARRAGLTDLHERRCDSLLVALRKVLGAHAIRTVRGRGWMLQPDVVDRAAALLDT